MKVTIEDRIRTEGKYEFRYRLFEVSENGRTYYSFEIEQHSVDGFESKEADDVCDTREEAEELYGRMYDGCVTPSSLHDIAEDYIYKKSCV